ncbi:MAG TPA: ABC transporter permease [Vicinamibacterales bacterium]|nr:ABC transporter permease [Vicinamibacterales bacterium]
MTNIIAIARKELRGYFASPVGYVVVGLYSIVFGYFYAIALNWFVQQSMQAPQMGGGPLNVNQQMIRYVFMNSTVVNLFVVPLITMRTYAEEKRSGTIELLMTSPVTDFQIIVGKFLGALGLYLAMMAVTLLHMAVLFVYGNPEWKPVLTAYLGMLLLGGSFLSVGLFFSSLTRNQIVAGMFTFAVLMLLWVIDWLGTLAGPTFQSVMTYLSLTGHLEDFLRGVVDTRHLVYYLSFITFGLFLTAKAVDSERWRG